MKECDEPFIFSHSSRLSLSSNVSLLHVCYKSTLLPFIKTTQVITILYNPIFIPLYMLEHLTI